MTHRFTASYLQDSIELFRYYKSLADKAMAQVSDEQLLQTLDAESNSIAIIVRHLAGNMRSRWQGFPDADGEKPTRDRDAEFENPSVTRQALLSEWEVGWAHLFAALDPLTDADLSRETTIRGERHSVLQAINRQVAHYACHCGQIMLLAKHFAAANWQSLTVPRGQSRQFNQQVLSGELSQR